MATVKLPGLKEALALVRDMEIGLLLTSPLGTTVDALKGVRRYYWRKYRRRLERG